MNCCFDCTAHAQILCRQKHCSIIPLPIKHCSSMDVIEMEFSDSSEQLDKDDKIKYKSKLLIDIFLADIYHYLKTTRREIPTKTPLEAFNFFVCMSKMFTSMKYLYILSFAVYCYCLKYKATAKY